MVWSAPGDLYLGCDLGRCQTFWPGLFGGQVHYFLKQQEVGMCNL